MKSYCTEIHSMMPTRTSTYKEWMTWHEHLEFYQMSSSLHDYSSLSAATAPVTPTVGFGSEPALLAAPTAVPSLTHPSHRPVCNYCLLANKKWLVWMEANDESALYKPCQNRDWTPELSPIRENHTFWMNFCFWILPSNVELVCNNANPPLIKCNPNLSLDKRAGAV